MTSITTKLDEYFSTGELPLDGTGCLCVAAQLLRNLEPSLLFIASSEGRPLGVNDIDVQCQPEIVHRVVSQVSTTLAHKPLIAFGVDTRSERSRIAFGIRLTAETDDGILGGVIQDSVSAHTELQELQPTLVACGSLIWIALKAVKDGKLHARRAKHHFAEQSTLRQAHADTVAELIEEREERIQQERNHIIHLEHEVERRSRELRDAMNKANQASLAKSTFLANMSHEIRTPMTAILGYADVLFESGNMDEAPPHRAEAIDTIRRNGRYLVELINDILDIAKIEAGKLHVERSRCSPSELITEVVELMKVRAKDRGLSLSAEIDGQIPAAIRSDATRVRQILINLVGNAIKFTDSGSVRIIVRHKGDASSEQSLLEIDIVDTGIGMSGPQIAKLFQPFSQIGDSTSNQLGGTGLGLALSRRLARALGGDICVTSIPGEGSTFRASVTTGVSDSTAMITELEAIDRTPSEAIGSATAPTHFDYRILLAEDGLDNQRLIKYMLERAGARVTVAHNGKLAVEAALKSEQDDEHDNQFDVILMDMQMPIMDGYRATTELRKAGFNKPIIALTANAMSSDRQKCIDAGCSDFATKPIDRPNLLELIASWCELRGAPTEQFPTD